MFSSLYILIFTSAWLTFTSGETTGERFTIEDTTPDFVYEEISITWSEKQPSLTTLETDVCGFDAKNRSMSLSSSWNPHLIIQEKIATIIDNQLFSIPARAFSLSMGIQVSVHLL